MSVFFLSWDGVGGSLLTAQAASFVKSCKPTILVPSRDEIFNPFEYLLKDQFEVLQVPEKQPDYLIKHGKKAIGISEKEECYLVYPDGLYRNPYAFDYKKYNTNPNLIKSTRVLTHKYKPEEKQIYIGLISSTEGYLYSSIPELLKCISKNLPDYTIHCPILSKWADIDIKMGDFTNLPSNIIIYENPDFISQIDLLFKCEYGIYTDNGMSHIAWHVGQNRLLLDPRFGYGRASLPWRVRWRQTDDDSVRIETLPQDIADLVLINLAVPQTNLIPKQIVLNNKYSDWSRELLFKY